MESYLSIGEVSRLLDIPESTLRFWQEKGIFTVSQGQNNYRNYTVKDLINIAEIAFYRNIGIPVKEMKDFSRLSLRDYDKILGGVGKELEEKLCMYEMMLESVGLKSQHIKDIELLKQVDYLYGEVPFDQIVAFDYSEKDKLIRYTKNPSLYVRWMDTNALEQDIRGIIAEQAEEDDTVLWHRSDNKKYAVFLIEEIASENYKNDIPQKLAVLQKKHKTGLLLANFLLSEGDGSKRIDYLKAYVELIEP